MAAHRYVATPPHPTSPASPERSTLAFRHSCRGPCRDTWPARTTQPCEGDGRSNLAVAMSSHRARIGGSARTNCRPAHRIGRRRSRSRRSERSSVKAAAGSAARSADRRVGHLTLIVLILGTASSRGRMPTTPRPAPGSAWSSRTGKSGTSPGFVASKHLITDATCLPMSALGWWVVCA
jgi:hypothetical protein